MRVFLLHGEGLHALHVRHGLVRQVGEVLSPILAAATTRRAQLLQMKETSTGHG